jgi:hypothetical protein
LFYNLVYCELCVQPFSFKTRLVDAGLFFNALTGLMGRGTKLPPQFGHLLFRTPSTQLVQKVHSNVQMCASVDSGGKSLSQHSQFGLNSNM